MNISKIHVLQILSLAGYLSTFIIVAFSLFLQFDVNGFYAVNGLTSSRPIALLAIFLSYFGSELVIGLLAGLFYLSSRGRAFELAFLILVTMAVADVTLLFLKAAYFRPRPYIVVPGVNLPFGPAGGSSFPSGHTTRAFAVMMFILFKKGRNYAPLIVIAIGVAFGRVLLGVHFPFDVVGGAFLGLFISTLSIRFGQRLVRFVVSILPERLKPFAK